MPQRFAGGGQFTPNYFDGLHWRAGLAATPRFQSSIQWDETGWRGGAVPTTGVIGVAPSTDTALEELAALYWNDAAILIEMAAEAAGALGWSVQMTGTIKGAQQSAGKLVFTVTDLGGPLDKPVVTARFTGAGGLEGGAEAAQRLKRRTWGYAFNIEGRVFDKAYSIYEFGDPVFPLQSFEQLRDIGRAGSLSILAWQGSAAATLAALRGVAVPDGGGVAAPSIAMARWWTQPSGPLTADVRGEIGTGYVETAPDIAARIVAAAGAGAIANLAAAVAIRGEAAGYHIDSDTETVANALDRLLLPISLTWAMDPDGPIRILPITLSAPIETVRSLSVTRQRAFAPMSSRRIGYQRAWRTHSDGEISSLLYAQDVAFADGTVLATVQPAEGGANVTETRTANDTLNVAGVPSPQVLAAQAILAAAQATLAAAQADVATAIAGVTATLGPARADIDATMAALTVTQAGLATAVTAINSLNTYVQVRPNHQVNGGFDRGLGGIAGLPASAGIAVNDQNWGNYLYHRENGTVAPLMPATDCAPGDVWTISFDPCIFAASGTVRMDPLFYAAAAAAGAGRIPSAARAAPRSPPIAASATARGRSFSSRSRPGNIPSACGRSPKT